MVSQHQKTKPSQNANQTPILPPKGETTHEAPPYKRKGASKSGRVKNSVTISGHGDYTLKKNSLLSGTIPAFGQNQRPIRVIHKEYVCPVKVNSNGSFRNDGYYVNPGNVALFPWLSQIALMYDSYDINGMIVYYKSFTSEQYINAGAGNNAPFSGAISEIILCSDYNVSDPLHTNKLSALNTEFTVSGKTSRDLIHAIECDNRLSVMGGKRFICDKTNPSQFYKLTNTIAPQDPLKYFFNTINVITQGAPASTEAPDWEAGELWISYDITLYKAAPQVNSLPQQLWFEGKGIVNTVAPDPAARAVNYRVLGGDFAMVGGNLPLILNGTDPGFHTGLSEKAAATTSWGPSTATLTAINAAGTWLTVPTYAGATPLPANYNAVPIVQGQQIVFPTWLVGGTYKITITYTAIANNAFIFALSSPVPTVGSNTTACLWARQNANFQSVLSTAFQNDGKLLSWNDPTNRTLTDPTNQMNWRNIYPACSPIINGEPAALGTAGCRFPYDTARTVEAGTTNYMGYGTMPLEANGAAPGAQNKVYSFTLDPFYFTIRGANAKWTMPQTWWNLVTEAAGTAVCQVRIEEINDTF